LQVAGELLDKLLEPRAPQCARRLVMRIGDRRRDGKVMTNKERDRLNQNV